jgi:MscS family membrane protein
MVTDLDLFDLSLPDFLNNQYGDFLILLGFWIVIGLMVVLVVRPMVHRLFAKTETDVDDRILEIIDVPIMVIIFTYGAVESLRVLDIIPGWFNRMLLTMYGFIVSVVVVYLAYKVFRAVFIPLGTEYAQKKDSELDKSILPVVDQLGGATILILGLFWVLSNTGIDVTIFLAGMGVAGLILAFALQDTLSNYFAGLHLMLDKPFKTDDMIKFGDDYCRVLAVGFRSTRLYSIHKHDIMIVPNNIVANQTIINKTEPDLNLRISVKVGVAYGSPVEKVKELIMDAVRSHDGIVQNDPRRAPTVRFRNFGESAMEFRTRFFIKDIKDQWRIAGDIREGIEERFTKEGITIPFPQRTLSWKSLEEESKWRDVEPIATDGGPQASPTG